MFLCPYRQNSGQYFTLFHCSFLLTYSPHFTVHTLIWRCVVWYFTCVVIINHLTSWITVLFGKPALLWLVKNFHTFYGAQIFIVVLTTARHLSPFWSRFVQSMSSHPTSLWSVLILSSYLHLGIPSGLFPSGFGISRQYEFHWALLSPLGFFTAFEV